MRLANRDLNHGFQARYPSPTTLAPVERIGSDTKSSYWSNFRRQRRVRTTSCLTYFKSRGAPAPRTQLLTISPLSSRVRQIGGGSVPGFVADARETRNKVRAIIKALASLPGWPLPLPEFDLTGFQPLI